VRARRSVAPGKARVPAAIRAAAALATVLGVTGRAASAAPDAPPAVATVTAAAADAAADDIVARPLVLPAGGVELRLVTEIELSIRRLGEPASLAPDALVGVTDELSVGVVHSASGLGLVEAGHGYCLRDDAHGCARAYDNVGVEARWSTRPGPLAIAAHGRLLVRSFDPWKPRASLGALLRWSRGRFGVTSDPALSVGLAHREAGNRADVDVPLWFAVQPTRGWAIHLRTGVHGIAGELADTYEVPLGVGTAVALSRHVDLAAEAAFRRLLGPLNDFKTRSAWVAVTVRWP
jgi:hypothetical protein